MRDVSKTSIASHFLFKNIRTQPIIITFLGGETSIYQLFWAHVPAAVAAADLTCRGTAHCIAPEVLNCIAAAERFTAQ